MNKLPEKIIYHIYKYKHHSEYKDMMDELLSKRILCRYNLSLSAVRQMMYRNKDGVLITCIDLDNIDVGSFELLNIINQNDLKLYLIYLFYFVKYNMNKLPEDIIYHI